MSRRKIALHVSDAPLLPVSGEKIQGIHFVIGGATYGRFLFTERPFAVEIRDGVRDVLIQGCYVEWV